LAADNSFWAAVADRVTLRSAGKDRSLLASGTYGDRATNKQFSIALSLVALAACSQRLAAPRDFIVFFETDQAALTVEGQQIVVEIAANARALSPSKIVVAGHADGGTAHDAALADQRATSVMRALIDQGISAPRIEKQADAPPPERSGFAAHQVVIRLLP
jgi:outer membrane protein OmpA-like peptidoglycan-associated protein